MEKTHIQLCWSGIRIRSWDTSDQSLIGWQGCLPDRVRCRRLTCNHGHGNPTIGHHKQSAYRQVTESGQLAAVFGLVLVAMGVWVYGRWHGAGASAGRARFGLIAGLGLVAFGTWTGWPQAPAPTDVVWDKWSPETVATLRCGGSDRSMSTSRRGGAPRARRTSGWSFTRRRFCALSGMSTSPPCGAIGPTGIPR